MDTYAFTIDGVDVAIDIDPTSMTAAQVAGVLHMSLRGAGCHWLRVDVLDDTITITGQPDLLDVARRYRALVSSWGPDAARSIDALSDAQLVGLAE